nr:hypothetical protein 1 [ssRNA positive-strand virus sp.]
MYFLLLFVYIQFVSSSVLKSSLLPDLNSSGIPPTQFYQSIYPTLEFQFNTRLGSFITHPECFSIHRTNSLLYVGCELPRFCGSARTYIFDSTIFGQETVLCYSLSSVITNTLEVHNMKFVPRDLPLSKPFSRNSLTVLRHVVPVHLAEHFFILSNTTHFSLLPKICSILFSFSSSELPSVITLKNNNKYVCIDVIKPILNCTLNWFPHVVDILKYHDFPVSYAGCPTNIFFDLDQNTYVHTHYYRFNSTSSYHVSNHENFLFLTHNDNHLIVYADINPPPNNFRHCLEITSAYSNPFSNIFHFLVSKLEYIFREILSTVILVLEDLSKIILKFIFILVSDILSYIPFTSNFLNSLLSFIFFKIYYKDIFLSAILSVVLLILLNLNSFFY